MLRARDRLASLWRRAMVYLGLQDDDEYGYDAYSEYDDAYAEQGPAPNDFGEAGGRQTRPDLREHRIRRDHRDHRDHRDPAAPVGYGEPAVRALPRDEPPSAVVVQRPAVVRTLATTAAKVHVVEPRGFNDAQEIGDRVKSNQAVILNLQGSTRDLQRRLIDFSSGLAYAVGGSMSRVADSVFLLTPVDVELSEEEKDRLEARGLYRR